MTHNGKELTDVRWFFDKSGDMPMEVGVLDKKGHDGLCLVVTASGMALRTPRERLFSSRVEAIRDVEGRLMREHRQLALDAARAQAKVESSRERLRAFRKTFGLDAQEG